MPVLLVVARSPLKEKEWDKLNPPTLVIGNAMIRKRCFMLTILPSLMMGGGKEISMWKALVSRFDAVTRLMVEVCRKIGQFSVTNFAGFKCLKFKTSSCSRLWKLAFGSFCSRRRKNRTRPKPKPKTRRSWHCLLLWLFSSTMLSGLLGGLCTRLEWVQGKLSFKGWDDYPLFATEKVRYNKRAATTTRRTIPATMTNQFLCLLYRSV